MTVAQDGGKVVRLTHRQLLPQEILPVFISVRGCAEASAIVRSEGLCQWNIPLTPFRIEPATNNNNNICRSTTCKRTNIIFISHSFYLFWGEWYTRYLHSVETVKMAHEIFRVRLLLFLQIAVCSIRLTCWLLESYVFLQDARFYCQYWNPPFKKIYMENPENFQEPQGFTEHDFGLNVAGDVSCGPLCGECASRTLKKH